MQPWDSWGMEEQSRQKHQQNAHNQQLTSRQTKEDSEPDIDFFGDMKPEFKKAAKV